MRTLVFCTSYAEHGDVWNLRQAWWLRSLQGSNLHFDQLLIVDDASCSLPTWPHLKVISEAEAPTPADARSTAPIVLYTHRERLGRRSIFDFPGWHRSFAFGALYAAAHGFNKVIHLESDAHLISPRIQHHFNEFDDGWAAAWSAKYTFPEIAIQVAARSGVAEMATFARRPYRELVGRLHETALPYTHIESTFIGDRFGEAGETIPPNVDFVSQANIGQSADYYWWIKPEAVSRSPPGLLALAPARSAPPLSYLPPFETLNLYGGWSHAEVGMRWMTDADSRAYLPAVHQQVDHRLTLEVRPCIIEGGPSSQRLYVLMNDRIVDEVMLFRSTTISCSVPASALSTSDSNCIRFLHPDAFAPSSLGVPDDRRLSVALKRITLTPCPVTDVAEAPPVRKRLFAKR
jgi:hypothetical protein